MFRRLLLLAIAASLLGSPRIAIAAPVPEQPGHSPKLLAYLAKGGPNSCGQGCDRWIAIEGRVDAAAAARVRQFLGTLKSERRPIYFHSPGGELGPALAIGRLLRARKAIVRVGRTVVTACATGSQADVACLKLKAAGKEVEAGIETRLSMCNSACSYLFLGGTTREIAPDAAFGVHYSKLIMKFRGQPTAEQRTNAMVNVRRRSYRETTDFVTSMGVGRELIELVESTPFERVHVLTRPELYSLRIDPRDFAETNWIFEPGVRPYIRKMAVAKKDDTPSFRTIEWRLTCENKTHVRLLFIRETDPAGGRSTVAMVAGSERPPVFGATPVRKGSIEIWSSVMTADAVKDLFAPRYIQVGERTEQPDGKTGQSMFQIETRGLEYAWGQLAKTCAGIVRPEGPAIPEGL